MANMTINDLQHKNIKLFIDAHAIHQNLYTKILFS